MYFSPNHDATTGSNDGENELLAPPTTESTSSSRPTSRLSFRGSIKKKFGSSPKPTPRSSSAHIPDLERNADDRKSGSPRRETSLSFRRKNPIAELTHAVAKDLKSAVTDLFTPTMSPPSMRSPTTTSTSPREVEVSRLRRRRSAPHRRLRTLSATHSATVGVEGYTPPETPPPTCVENTPTKANLVT